MKRKNSWMGAGLFDQSAGPQPVQLLGEGAALLRGFAADSTDDLLAALHSIVADAPFRHMTTPGGFRMSVAMTNCGPAGWVTDRNGYRYETLDPVTSKPWPSMPPVFANLAQRAAAVSGFPEFQPDSCLINRYEPGSKLTLHQDRDERNFAFPIVSVSLGLSAVFLFGGMKRADRPRRILLESGDVVVWGGPSRLAFHGIDTLAEGEHPATGRARINLTFRKAL